MELGEEQAKVELTRYSDEISKYQGPEWVSFKTQIKQIIKISEADLKELKKSSPVQISVNTWSNALDFDREGEIKTGLKNCSIVIDKHPEIEGGIGFNDFLQRPCFTKNMPFMSDIKLKEGDFIEFDDTKLAQISVWLAHNAAEFKDGNIIKSVTDSAMRNRFNPLAQKLMECNEKWDEKPRLDTWLFDYLNAGYHDGIDEQHEKEYISRVGAMWMISAVARAFSPGCKVDTMLILEGKQGEGKSQFIEELSFGYFVDLTTNLSRSKDVVDQLFGKWIVELPELKSFSNDANSNKAFLARRKDSERLSYAKFSKDFPRRCVFIGTTNDDRYLKDLSGNRRFWPVKVGKADRAKLKEDIDQLWGEAVERWSKGERWWLEEKEDKNIIQTSNLIQGIKLEEDELKSSLELFLDDMEFITTEDVWTKFYRGEVNRFNKSEQMRVADSIRSCGWVRGKKGSRRGWKPSIITTSRTT